MKTSKPLVCSVFSSVVFACLLFGTATAQNDQNTLSSLVKFNIRVANQSSVKQSVTMDLQAKFDNLILKAHENGSVRVIVKVRLDDYKSDAELSNQLQRSQRASIKQKQASLLNYLNKFNIENVKMLDYIPFLGMEITADALETLRGFEDVVSIREDERQQASLLESIPILGGSAFGGPSGGTFGGFSGLGRTIAILDTGVDKTHPFFNNRVVSEACYSTNSATTASVCPGGASSSTASNSGLHCNVAGCTHGTHVAGIAAGGNPTIGGNGVARDVNIIAIQVFSRKTDCQSTSDCTTAFNIDTIKALERVYALRTTYAIDAVNMSLGGGRYFSYCDTELSDYKMAIDNLRAAGIATIIASGNEGFTDSLASPACVSTSFSVGSTTDGDTFPIDFVSTFSNSANFLNLLAPGERILSSYPGAIYENSQGTSQATPMVAGAWAVMKQKFPSDTIAQTFTRLKYGGVQVLDSRSGLVKPRIKVDTALNTSSVDPCNSSTAISFGQTVNGVLANTDCLIPLGSRADVYSFSGTQGQSVAITETSSAFFTYLFLFNSNGVIIGQNGNAGTSRIPPVSGFMTLPATGTYFIYATSVAGNTFGNYTLNLATNGCSFAASSSSQNFAANGGNGNFNITAGGGCAWTAQSNAAWLTTTSTGNGNGQVNYAVVANTSSTQRTATVTVGGQIHTVTQAGITTTITRRPFDFDGDGKTDISIFRPSAGEWYYIRSGNAVVNGARFGSSTDKPIPADYTGDGKTDLAFFRPASGQWFILRSEDSSFYAFPFGVSTDIPTAGDFDGDGKADQAVFRPSNGVWYINRSTGGTTIQQFGTNGDRPVVADYDGDGKSDIAIFRPSVGEWYYLRSSDSQVRGARFGASTDKTVQGDYTGDGKADFAFFRPSTGSWFVLRSEDSSFFASPFGISTDTPTIGDYDGDGKFDQAVFRPSNGVWYVNKSNGSGVTIQPFGASTDLPVPSYYLP